VTRRLGLPAETLVVCALLASIGFLFARNLDARTTYDEGVYLASLDVLRHGQTLGSDVFGSQPPGFYTVLRFVGLFGGSSITDLRLGFLAIALVGCLGAYLVGRLLLGVAAGVAASALVAITPPFASEAPRVSADVPSAALALVGLALAAAALRPRARAVVAAAAGAAIAAAVSVKLSAVTAVVPLAALAVARRASPRQVAAAVAGAAVVAVALVAAYAGALGSIWEQAFSFHTSARGFGGGEPNGHTVVHFLDFRTPSGWLIVGGAAASIVVRRTWSFWLWVGAAALLLLLQKPLFEHHLVLLAASAGLAAGLGLGGVAARLEPRLAVAAVAAVVAALAVGLAQQVHRLDYRREAEPSELRWGWEHLAACTRPGERVASDQPIVAFRARRQLPGELVDTSLVRVQTGSLPPARVLEVLRRDRIRAVFVGRSFEDEPALVRALRARYPTVLRNGTVAIYARARACS
jgi:4-amino-4-deoxy-L-arabinose transferase-like glycosyltransferase